MYWEYDSRIGRRWNGDPLEKKFPWQSPYATLDGNPIWKSDPTGMAASKPDDWVGTKEANGNTVWTYDKNITTVEQAKQDSRFKGKEIVDVKATHDFAEPDGSRTNLWADGTTSNTNSTGFNSPLARSLVKDSYSLNLSGAGNFLAGGVQGTIGFNWITRGSDASLWPYMTIGGGGQFNAFSIDAGVNASVGNASFNGPVSGINSKMFLGYTVSAGASLNAEFLGKIGVGASHGWGLNDKGGTAVNFNSVSVGVGVGVGSPIQANTSLTNTKAVIRLDDMIKITWRLATLKIPGTY